MLDLERDLRRLCYRNRDGSHLTQAQRSQRLRRAARDLHDLGYRHLRATSLKPKHVDALAHRWRGQGLSPGTIKNRLADLRWWAEKVDKPAVVARDNSHYGVPERRFVTNEQRGRDLDKAALARVPDRHVVMSLRLQEEFGLRREEAIKFRPAYADKGDRLRLKASWCKGGRMREIPVRTLGQRAVLQEAHVLAGVGSLIPPERSYVQQRRVYERQTARAGLSRLHGLRHRYAQTRYHELTGRPAPAAGGLARSELTHAELEADLGARLTISEELGHERTQITAIYLGR